MLGRVGRLWRSGISSTDSDRGQRAKSLVPSAKGLVAQVSSQGEVSAETLGSQYINTLHYRDSMVKPWNDSMQQ